MAEIKPAPPLLLKYLRAYEKNPGSRVFAPLAECYRKAEMHDEAIKVLQKGIRLHPDYSLAYYSLAHCYFDRSQFDLAYASLRPFVAKSLDNFRMQQLFAKTCLKCERYQEALETFKYLLFINPRDTEVAAQVKNLEEQFGEIVSRSLAKQEQKDVVDDLDESPEEWSTLSPESNENVLSFDEVIAEDKFEGKTENKSFDETPGLGEVSDISWETQDMFKEKVSEWTIENTEIIKPVSDAEDESPVLTLTLAELYINQGHLNKALEVLTKFKKLGHISDDLDQKIAEVLGLKKSQVVHKEEVIQEESSGSYFNFSDDDDQDEEENDLMQAFDDRILSKQKARYDRLEGMYSDFLTKLRSQSQHVLKESS